MSETKPITPEDLERLDALFTKPSEPYDRWPSHSFMASIVEMWPGIRARITLMMTAIAEMYQYAGATDAPVEILDNLSALANGESPPHPWNWKAPDGPNDLRARIAELGQKVYDLTTALSVEEKMHDHTKTRIEEMLARNVEQAQRIEALRAECAGLVEEGKRQAGRIAELEKRGKRVLEGLAYAAGGEDGPVVEIPVDLQADCLGLQAAIEEGKP